MRIPIIVSILLLTNITVFAQQIAGSDCETWTENHYNTSYPSLYYWEMQPSNIWASSNSATTILNSFCLQRTTDAHSGQYAAYLETKSIFSQPASGNLFTGYFIADLFNSKAMRGIPFTAKPAFFKGYYKYTSVSYSYGGNTIPDSCAIYTILSKWNGSQRIVIADAIFYSSANVSTYTLFNVPFTYYLSDTPDTISIVFASSKNGEFYRGGIGSKLYIDDILLEYPSQIEDNSLKVNFRFTQDQLNFDFDKSFTGNLNLFNMEGKKIFSDQVKGNSYTRNVNDLRPGLYTVVLSANDKIVYSGKLFKP